MRELRFEIMDYLDMVPHMNKDFMIGILNPLKTEEQAMKMLEYLKENKDNEEVMRVDRIIKKSLQISEEN